MKLVPKQPPREFVVHGAGVTVTLADCGTISLEPDEQVTFTTAAGGEYDVVRKDWGFYATPSTNGRLRQFGLRTALVVNSARRLYVLLVEIGREAAFFDYLERDRQQFVCWLDSDESVDDAVARLTGGQAG